MYHLLAGPTRSPISTRKMYPDSSTTVPEYARQHTNSEIPGILVHATLPFDVVASVREILVTPYGVQVHVSPSSSGRQVPSSSILSGEIPLLLTGNRNSR